jgi:hypothetical protein
MSGGSLNYFYIELAGHSSDLGDKELNELVKDLAELFHDREWFLSGDTGEGSWRESRDAFKAKWFSEHGRQERIEQYLAEFADEIRETFGISNKRCGNCKHWTPEQDERYGSKYGSCDFEKQCLMHRSESCDKFDDNKNGV